MFGAFFGVLWFWSRCDYIASFLNPMSILSMSLITEAARLFRTIPDATVLESPQSACCMAVNEAEDVYVIRLNVSKVAVLSVQISNARQMYLSVLNGQVVYTVDDLITLLTRCEKFAKDFPGCCRVLPA